MALPISELVEQVAMAVAALFFLKTHLITAYHQKSTNCLYSFAIFLSLNIPSQLHAILLLCKHERYEYAEMIAHLTRTYVIIMTFTIQLFLLQDMSSYILQQGKNSCMKHFVTLFQLIICTIALPGQEPTATLII